MKDIHYTKIYWVVYTFSNQKFQLKFHMVSLNLHFSLKNIFFKEIDINAYLLIMFSQLSYNKGITA